MEFVGAADDSGAVAAPRLHEPRPGPEQIDRCARRLLDVVIAEDALGVPHGDQSPYHLQGDDRAAEPDPVVIGVPQVVEVIANPHGRDFLRRDCQNVCSWLRARGAEPSAADPQEWFDTAMRRWES